MAKEDLKREIQSLYQAADGGMGLAQLVDGICHTLQKHEDALRGITYSYRLCASDTATPGVFPCGTAILPRPVNMTRPTRLSPARRKTYLPFSGGKYPPCPLSCAAKSSLRAARRR